MLNLRSGKRLSTAKPRPTHVWRGMSARGVYVGESDIVTVENGAVVTRNLRTGATRARRRLPPLPSDAGVVVTQVGKQLLVLVGGGGLGDGYLLVYEGKTSRALRGVGLALGARVIGEHLLVETDRSTWESLPLAHVEQDLASPSPIRADPRQRVREIIAEQRVDQDIVELRALPHHDAFLAEIVRNASYRPSQLAFAALEKLRSPELPALALDILAHPPATEPLPHVDLALEMLSALRRPVPLPLLSPYLAREGVDQALLAALLGNGDAEALRALDTLMGKTPARSGWQDLCVAAPSRNGRQLPQCHHDARDQGAVAVAIVDDALWLRRATIKGPAWVGLISPAPGQRLPLPPAAQIDKLLHDSDGDGIPDETERCLGLSPASADSDGDGLPDARNPSPTRKTVATGARVEFFRAGLAHVVRFDEPELASLAILDAPTELGAALEGVAAVTLTTDAPLACGLRGTRVKLEARGATRSWPRPSREGLAALVVDELAFDGQKGTLHVAFVHGYSGYSIRLELELRDGSWRVVRRHPEESWDE